MLKRFFSRKPKETIILDNKIDLNNEYSAMEIALDRLPQHVAIIMDGNGRWAKQQGKPRTYGHYIGAETLRKIVKIAQKLNIKALTAYAFSTENWKRPQLEVDILMGLLDKYLTEEIEEFNRNNIKVVFSGNITGLSSKLQAKVQNTLRATAENTGLVLNLAINYGGRAEILAAVKKVVVDTQAGQLDINNLTEEKFAKYLYTENLPDVDLLIRPGGDMRISNFLLWQIAYAEIWLTDKYWPEFTAELFIQAIQDFQKRDRRFGGLK